MNDNIENRANRAGEILQHIKNWDTKEFYRDRFKDNDKAEYYSQIVNTITEVAKNAKLSKGKSKLAMKDFIQRKTMFEDNLNDKIQVLEMGKQLVCQFEKPIDILYVIDNINGDKVLLKNIEDITDH